MPDLKLTLIDNPDRTKRTILQNNVPKGTPLFKGDGDWNYLCGKCGVVLGESLPKGLPFLTINRQLAITTCNSCGAYNELPYAPK